MDAIRGTFLVGVCATFMSLALGVGIVESPQVSFVVLVAVLATAAFAAPACGWVLSALVAALVCRGLVQLDVLPAVATYIDVPLAWGALAVALLKQRPVSRLLKHYLLLLCGLALAVLAAWAFNPSEVLRPVLYLMLLGEPFAVVCAIIADPPSPRLRRWMEMTLIMLLVIQIPIAGIQFATLGGQDHVQGTLYGAGAGAHVISAVAVVGGIWILSGGGRLPLVVRLPASILLFVLPFLADAKQVIVAAPAIVLASSWRGSRFTFVVRSALAIGAVVALFTLVPAGTTTKTFLVRAEQGEGGKQKVASLVWDKINDDPSSLAFGKGPAETVSRAAFMTTSLFERSGSPLASLGLRPAAMPREAESAALLVSGGGTSFNSGTSSALGVLGDLGILGFLVYLFLPLLLFLRLRRERSPEGVAAASGFALFLALGLVFDWWEQPPFGVTLGVLAGLALTRPGGTADATAARLESPRE